MNAVMDTEVPESSVLGTTDKHEEKSIDEELQIQKTSCGTKIYFVCCADRWEKD